MLQKPLILQKPAVSIDGHESVPANNEAALLKAVANQPVSVAIEAAGSNFQFYSEASFLNYNSKYTSKNVVLSFVNHHSRNTIIYNIMIFE